MAVSASEGDVRSVEFRAGLVLYGGVSLAVYMGGVATEFLDAVRAVRAENPYSPLLKALNGRFVVDVIAGASAGGINGVFLARALATNGRIDHLADLWQKYGDFSVLTDWQGAEPESVLNGRRFLEELKNAMGQVGDPEGESLVPILDLFVTATDMQGKYWARSDDLNHLILGRNHGRLIHLKYRSQYSLVDEDDGLGYAQNDFKAYKPENRSGSGASSLTWSETGDFLATVCRTTAAFPGAFEPVDFRDDLREPSELPDGRSAAWMTDGGVLQNRPFAPVLRKIFRRAAGGRVERSLFYVEPVLDDPNVLSDAERSRKPNAFRVVQSSLELPMYQGIAQHLQELEEHNKIVRNLHQVMESLEPRAASADQKAPVESPAFRAYLALRAGDWSTALRERWHQATIARIRAEAGGETYRRIDQALALTRRQLEEFDQRVTKPAEADPQRFLKRCDLSFHLRRLEYLIERCSRLYLRSVDPKDSPDAGRTARQRSWEKRVIRQEAILWRALDRLRTAEKRFWEKAPDSPTEVADGLEEVLCRWTEAEEHGIQKALKALSTLAPEQPGTPSVTVDFEHIYAQFEVRDQLLFPLGVGSHLGERDLISWVRLSPYDASSIFRPEQGEEGPSYQECLELGRKKIAGDSLMNFGGFLSWRWRANDFMWGRLDAVDTIISTLVAQAERSGHYTPDELESIRQAGDKAREHGFKRAIQANLHPIGQQELARFVEQRLAVERTLQARIARARFLTGSLQTAQERRQVATAAETGLLGRAGPHTKEGREADGTDGAAPDRRSAARELVRLLPQMEREMAGLEWTGAVREGLSGLGGVLSRIAATGLVTEEQGGLLERAQALFSQAAAAVRVIPVEVEGRLVQGERLTYAPWMVEILDWAGLHTFLMHHYNTGAEDLKNLHPGVTAHVGIDVAENLRRVAAGVMERSSRPVPPLAHKLGQVIGYPIQWASKVIRPLIPRPRIGQDDRVPPLWQLVAQLIPLLIVAVGYIGTKFGFSGAAVLAAAVILLGAIPVVAWKLRGKADIRDLPAPPAVFWGWGLMMILVAYGSQWLDWTLPGTAVTPLEVARVLGWGMLTAYVVMSLTLLLTRGFQGRAVSRSLASRLGVGLLRGAVGLLSLAVVLSGTFLLHSHARGTGLPAPVAARVEAEKIRVPGLVGAGYPPEGIALTHEGAYLITTLDGYVLRRNAEAPEGWDPPLGQRLTAALGVQPHGRDSYLLAGTEQGKGGGLYRWAAEGAASGAPAGRWERLIEIPGTPNGLAAYGQHVYVSTEPGGWKIWHVRLDGGPVRRETLKGSLLGSLWAAPNGLAIREVRGAGGKVERVSLLVGEMVSGRLWEIPLTADGEIDPQGEPRSLAQFPGFVDGVLALRDGRIAVSTNEGFLYIYSPRLGKVTHSLKIPERRRAAANMVEDDGRIAFAAIGQFELLGKWLFNRSFPGDELAWVKLPTGD